MIEIGLNGAPTRAELEAAFSSSTVAVLFFAGAHFAQASLPLEDVVEVAHARGVPVIVDAAAQIPPIANLRRFTRELGADAAIFSGGKGLRGPQSSGLVLGKRSLIEACRLNGPPNHSLGRPMKVGKEEMLGVLAATKWSLAQDEEAILASYEAVVERWISALSGRPGVQVERSFPSEAGQPHSRAIIKLGPPSVWTRAALVDALWEHEPRIAVSLVGDDEIALNPQTLEPGEDVIVLEALTELLDR
jgi:L-seryl-tRNA(Ser) seleniumtransferase